MPKHERAGWDREGLFLQEIDGAHTLYMGRVAPSVGPSCSTRKAAGTVAMKMPQGLSHLRAAVFTAVPLRGLLKSGYNFRDNAEMPIFDLM